MHLEEKLSVRGIRYGLDYINDDYIDEDDDDDDDE